MTSIFRVAAIGPAYLEKFYSVSKNRQAAEKEEGEQVVEETVDILHDILRQYPEDPYALLGLKERYAAPEKMIKLNYRKLVLVYHPDKTGKRENDALFKKIQQAYDRMCDPVKRRIFDSIDPLFDNSIPETSSVTSENFLQIYGPVFERRSRFSKKQPVPQLGGVDDPKETIDSFYNFWARFESWRSFEGLDEEDSSKGENREEKRYIEKQNKAERTRRKKEDTAKVNKLVSDAMKLDPRLRKFKDQAKNEKERVKMEKIMLKQKKEQEEKKRIEEERLAKEREAEAAKEAAMEEKKKKEALKNAIRKEKKAIKNKLKEYNYFLDVATPDAMTDQLAKLEYLFEQMTMEGLREFNSKMEESREMGEWFFNETVQEKKFGKPKTPPPVSVAESNKEREWNPKEIQALIQGVNSFPGGTLERWEKIADFINHHTNEPLREPKEVIRMYKHVQSNPIQDTSMFQQFERKIKDPRIQNESSDSPEIITWSKEEQLLLEEGLKKFPASDPQRWSNIATHVNTKSKKECILRFKDLAQKVKK